MSALEHMGMAGGPKMVVEEEAVPDYNGKSTLKEPRYKVYKTQLTFKWRPAVSDNGADASRYKITINRKHPHVVTCTMAEGKGFCLAEELEYNKAAQPLHPDPNTPMTQAIIDSMQETFTQQPIPDAAEIKAKFNMPYQEMLDRWYEAYQVLSSDGDVCTLTIPKMNFPEGSYAWNVTAADAAEIATTEDGRVLRASKDNDGFGLDFDVCSPREVAAGGTYGNREDAASGKNQPLDKVQELDTVNPHLTWEAEPEEMICKFKLEVTENVHKKVDLRKSVGAVLQEAIHLEATDQQEELVLEAGLRVQQRHIDSVYNRMPVGEQVPVKCKFRSVVFSRWYAVDEKDAEGNPAFNGLEFSQDKTRFGVSPSILQTDSTTGQTSYRSVNFNGGLHGWSVKARNTVGVSTEWSPEREFHIKAAPGNVKVVAPLHRVYTRQPVVEWTAQSSAESYKLRIVSVKSGIAVIKKQLKASEVPVELRAGVALCSMPVHTQEALEKGKYTVTVKAVNPICAGDWCKVTDFEICGPPKISVYSPINGCDIATQHPVFKWGHSKGALRYMFILQKKGVGPEGHKAEFWYDVDQLVDRQRDCDRCCLQLHGVTLELGTYIWKVRSRNNVGLSAWSHEEQFCVNIMPSDAVDLLSPLQPMDNTGPVQFKWRPSPSANRYKLTVTKVPHVYDGADPDLGVNHNNTKGLVNESLNIMSKMLLASDVTGSQGGVPICSFVSDFMKIPLGKWSWAITPYSDVGPGDSSEPGRFEIMLPDPVEYVERRLVVDPSGQLIPMQSTLGQSMSQTE